MSEPKFTLKMPKTAEPVAVLREAVEALEHGLRVVLASVVARHGSAPSTPGQKLVLIGAPKGTESGELRAVGTIGGGAIERVVLASMLQCLCDRAPLPRIETFKLGASLGMCCGGSVDILMEPMSPSLGVLVIGAGHVGVFLAPLLASLGFRTVLIDKREEAMDAARFPDGMPGVMRILAEPDDPEVIAQFPHPDISAAVVMTHDHKLDQAAIEWAIAQGFGFVGGVGSRAKAARTRTRLEHKHVAAHDIERVRMPLGIDIGARLPSEIGVSIAAELIRYRKGLLPAEQPEPQTDAPSPQKSPEPETEPA